MAQNYSYPSTAVTFPAGGATAANQVIEIGELQDINASTTSSDGHLASIDTKTPSLGQKTMANSSPVVIASDQGSIAVTGPLTDTQLRASPVPVSATALPLPTGAATEATLAALSAKTAGALVPTAFDEVDLTYITVGNGIGQIGTAVYKLSGSTVKTLTLTYDVSDRLSTVVAS